MSLFYFLNAFEAFSIWWMLLRHCYILNTVRAFFTWITLSLLYLLNTFEALLYIKYFFGFFSKNTFESFLFGEWVWGFGRPASGIARGRLWSVQLELMDEISRDSLTGSNFTKGRGFSGYNVFEISFSFSKCGSMIFGENENLKSLSSLGDFPREDNLRKFSL